MSRATLYLSGGMEKAIDLGSQWRLDCSSVLRDLDYIPVDITALDKAYTKLHGHVYLPTDEKNFIQYKSNIRYQFVYTDLKLITDICDATICYYDEAFKNGAGSFAEAQITYDCGKPMFLVSNYSFDETPGWLKSLSTKMFHSFNELYQYLQQLPRGILKVDKYGNHGINNQYLCSLCGVVFNKHGLSFSSKITPLLCLECVEITKVTYERPNRYDLCCELLSKEHEQT